MTLITKKDITVPITVQTRTALPPDRAFQPAVDLSLVFKGWGPFPAVRGVRNQTGAWDQAGASRNPILSDGSTATEKLTEYTAGHSFAYEVTGFTNVVLRGLVCGVRGEWTFTLDGSGTLMKLANPAFEEINRLKTQRSLCAAQIASRSRLFKESERPREL